MNKEKLIKICNIVAFIMALSFVLNLARDAITYHTTLNSARFYIWVIADAVYYLMPAAFLYLIGRLVKRAKDKEEQEN